MVAIMHAWRRVKTLEPTEVPKELATSLAPTPKARKNAMTKPRTTTHMRSGELGSRVGLSVSMVTIFARIVLQSDSVDERLVIRFRNHRTFENITKYLAKVLIKFVWKGYWAEYAMEFQTNCRPKQLSGNTIVCQWISISAISESMEDWNWTNISVETIISRNVYRNSCLLFYTFCRRDIHSLSNWYQILINPKTNYKK